MSDAVASGRDSRRFALAHDTRRKLVLVKWTHRGPQTRFIPLPRLPGRDREGACNKIPVCKLTPSPTLPRKRRRVQTEHAAC
jgi:hypothetical protein